MFSNHMKSVTIQALGGKGSHSKNKQMLHSMKRQISTLSKSLNQVSLNTTFEKSSISATKLESTQLQNTKIKTVNLKNSIAFFKNQSRQFTTQQRTSEQNEDNESTKKTATSGGKKRKFGILHVLGLSAASLFIYKFFQFFGEWLDYQSKVKIYTMPEIPEPATPFDHPMNNSSWIFRQWFRIRRIVYLCYVFTPVFWEYLVFSFRKTDEARQVFLDVLVNQLEKAGCSFLKFGQWLSMRPDMFPPDIINCLSKLRDNAPSHSIEETYDVFRQEFGLEIEDVFEHFDPIPVASGSIAQVYRATLKEGWARKSNLRDSSGALIYEVAVKVRHPKVLDETWMDVDLIFGFSNNTEKLTVPFSRDEFLNLMQKQVDFRWEGHYLSRFGLNFKDEIAEGHVKFPVVAESLLGTSVLIESWASGRSVDSIFTNVGDGFKASPAKSTIVEQKETQETGPTKLQEMWVALTAQIDNFDNHIRDIFSIPHKDIGVRLRDGEATFDPELYQDLDRSTNTELFDYALLLKKKQIAFTMFDMFLKMFLRDNLIHGDLHAGNVLYNQSHNACTVLDAGMTVTLEDKIIPEFGKFLLAICSGNPESLVERITIFEVNLPENGPGSGNGRLANMPKVREAFRKEVYAVTERFFQNSKYSGLDIMHSSRPKNVSIGDVVGQVLFAMQRHGVVLRGDVAASIMAMSVIEGLIRQLDPSLDIIFKSLPYFVKYRGFTSINSLTDF